MLHCMRDIIIVLRGLLVPWEWWCVCKMPICGYTILHPFEGVKKGLTHFTLGHSYETHIQYPISLIRYLIMGLPWGHRCERHSLWNNHVIGHEITTKIPSWEIELRKSQTQGNLKTLVNLDLRNFFPFPLTWFNLYVCVCVWPRLYSNDLHKNRANYIQLIQ